MLIANEVVKASENSPDLLLLIESKFVRVKSECFFPIYIKKGSSSSERWTKFVNNKLIAFVEARGKLGSAPLRIGEVSAVNFIDNIKETEDDFEESPKSSTKKSSFACSNTPTPTFEDLKDPSELEFEGLAQQTTKAYNHSDGDYDDDDDDFFSSRLSSLSTESSQSINSSAKVDANESDNTFNATFSFISSAPTPIVTNGTPEPNRFESNTKFGVGLGHSESSSVDNGTKDVLQNSPIDLPQPAVNSTEPSFQRSSAFVYNSATECVRSTPSYNITTKRSALSAEVQSMINNAMLANITDFTTKGKSNPPTLVIAQPQSTSIGIAPVAYPQAFSTYAHPQAYGYYFTHYQ